MALVVLPLTAISRRRPRAPASKRCGQDPNDWVGIRPCAVPRASAISRAARARRGGRSTRTRCRGSARWWCVRLSRSPNGIRSHTGPRVSEISQFHLAESSRPSATWVQAQSVAAPSHHQLRSSAARATTTPDRNPHGGSEKSDHRHASSSRQQKARPVPANQNRTSGLQGPEERAAIARVLPANRHDLHAIRQLEVHKPSGALSRSQLASAADRRLKRLTGRVV